MFCNFEVVGDPNHVICLSTNSSSLHVFLLCREHDPCSLYLGAMIIGMGIFIGCGYGSHTGIGVSTLLLLSSEAAYCSGSRSQASILTVTPLPTKFSSCKLNSKNVLSNIINFCINTDCL
jgi:hypothetical protein